MLVAAFFVVTMVVFMMKTGRKLKGEIEGKVGLLAGNDRLVGLFLFIFLMVLREGVETVLILSAVAEFQRTDEFHWNLPGRFGRDSFGVMFVQGQRSHQPAEVFQGHDGHPVPGGGPVADLRIHELSESGVIASSSGDGDHWADREQ